MICSFSGQKIPTEKLFVLYYPPSMAYQNWSESVYAAARAGAAIEAVKDELRNFRRRYVVGKDFAWHMAIGGLGLALLLYGVWVLAAGWSSAGFLSKFVAPFVGVILTLYGRFRYRAFAQRQRMWRDSGEAAARQELAEIEKMSNALPEDSSAEEAAPIMRRECPEVFSEIAFQGANFRAFTYLDFVLYHKLKHPTQREELPEQHSLYRDAYYVGELVYDSWRTFQRDRRDLVDPRFVGSGGRRGVI